jgi:hypothetical protein
VLPARCTFALRYPKLEQTDSIGRDRATQGTVFDGPSRAVRLFSTMRDTNATMADDVDAIAPPDAGHRVITVEHTGKQGLGAKAARSFGKVSAVDRSRWRGGRDRYNLALRARFCAAGFACSEDFGRGAMR